MAAIEHPLVYRHEQSERFDDGIGRQHLDAKAAARHLPHLSCIVESVLVEDILGGPRALPAPPNRLLRRVRDYAQVRGDGTLTREIASDALDLLQVDALGLDDLDRRVLRAIIEKYSGGPVGLNTIGASISEEPDTIMDVVEPYLLQLGFLDRTPQGRVATKSAYEHLGLDYVEGEQPRLL